ncbi:4Fe-4S binding protein [Tepidibacter formicigenes]|jgi:polyferredoxin|uniref:4Fe-4S binding domain-containing protein n=1 Tax=Tepidibacter formicigenes DSM 15518 TaxID=1123349 RepID=A0A1M6Q3Q1_9FIRM|nr:4Fe-4S binding protein [Tepidibacter formicigenes]SHK14756.1 4Fe-4S binding domain-containing protein [Tepidibacter formicigenes DSM 15518]
MKKNITKRKSYLTWSWILFITFMVLAIYDIRFAAFGLACMISPIVFSSTGQGKVHCSHYCPRGSFLGKFLNKLSIGYNVPSFMKNKLFKHTILIFMLTSFSLSLYKRGLTLTNIGSTIFRLVFVTTIVGIFLGIIYKPRTWCTICPMGHASNLIDKKVKKTSINKNTKKSA